MGAVRQGAVVEERARPGCDPPLEPAQLGEEIATRVLGFQERYQIVAKPFEWKFTRADLERLLNRCEARALEPTE